MSNLAKSWLSGKFRKPTQTEMAAMGIGAAIAVGGVILYNLWRGEALFTTPVPHQITTLFTAAGKSAINALPEFSARPIF